MEDIRSFEELWPYRGKPIKFSFDSGSTWDYGLLNSPPRPEDGLQGNAEVIESGVHWSYRFDPGDFPDGVIVRLVPDEEVKDKIWSYTTLPR